jgi:hypothetical protein
MKCHVCGRPIWWRAKQDADEPPAMDGWAWTLDAEGCIDIVTCAGCTPDLRAIVGDLDREKLGSIRYDAHVRAGVSAMIQRRFEAAELVGGQALRDWCDEAVSKPDRDARRALVYARLYGTEGEQLKQMLSRIPLDVDGKLGPRTEDQVRQLQEMLNRTWAGSYGKLSEWARQLSKVSQPMPASQTVQAVVHESSGKLPAFSDDYDVSEESRKRALREAAKFPGYAPQGLQDMAAEKPEGQAQQMRYVSDPPVELVTCCAITGEPTSKSLPIMRYFWEGWICRGESPRWICLDSPCSFELRRRLGVDLWSTDVTDGPWGKGFTREQSAAWLANPPYWFQEKTGEAIAAVRELFGGKCPLLAAGRDPCVACGKPSLTLFEKSLPVPLCGSCARIADKALLRDTTKEEIIRRVAAGDRYAWQRFVEAQPVFARWQCEEDLDAAQKLRAEVRRREASEDRRRRLREHPEEHIVTVLGMADFFGPKVR